MPETMEAGFVAVAALDPDLAGILAALGPPPSRRRPPGIATLLRAIIGQQVSTASAAAIWQRFAAGMAPFEPARLAIASEAELRALGLSGPKVRYVGALATAVHDGTLDLAKLEQLTNDAAIKALVQVKGIGQWTAEVYLLSALERADIWPAGDLALVLAVQDVKELPEKPDVKEMRRIGEVWQPYRSFAARLLWHHYGASRGRQAQPLDSA
jgi:DNA-3-methyladenine glycosylase II